MIPLKLPIHRFNPRKGAEWGSGGIFGLKYHMNVLYFTLSFDAEAYFINGDEIKVYRFEHLGPEPRSGGDTYNAVEVVDNKIYFGGWVNSPVIFEKVNNYSKINFTNKSSHIHSYDIYEDKVDLLWKESAGLSNEWVGEVSSLLFDPLNIKLLVSRADGSISLGVFGLDIRNNKMEMLSDKPSMKGALLGDMACFDISIGFDGIYGIQCLDLVRGVWTYKSLTKDLKDISIDGEGVSRPLQVGSIAAMYGRLFIFVRGGVIILDPSDGEGGSLYFVRLYDFCGKDYGPLRTNHVIMGGGMLIPFNAYTHGILKCVTNELRDISKILNYVPTTSNLLYITPPVVRVLGSFGARITSLEHVGDEILLGCNTMANLGADNATPYDIGVRDIISININDVPIFNSFNVIKVSGDVIGNNAWGGIPIGNYKKVLMHVKAGKDNYLRIYEYDFGLPPTLHETDIIDINSGKNVIDLSGYSNIVSFKFESVDPHAKIFISLRD
ncbi:MAG: DUF2139 domain-containing protein [Sulfolobales archaeon]